MLRLVRNASIVAMLSALASVESMSTPLPILECEEQTSCVYWALQFQCPPSGVCWASDGGEFQEYMDQQCNYLMQSLCDVTGWAQSDACGWLCVTPIAK